MAELTDIPTLSELENRLALVPGLDAASLEAESIAVLGRKSGALTAVLRRIPELPPEERKSFGATVNALKQKFEASVAAHFPPPQTGKIAALFADRAKLEAMPVHEFVAVMVKN